MMLLRGTRGGSLLRRRGLSFSPDEGFTPTHFDSQELLQRYIPDKVLGAGSFGNVYRATRISRSGNNTSAPQQVAIKAMLKSKCPFAMHEIELLQLLSPPGHGPSSKHVLQLVEWFETDTSFYLVTEYLRGKELFELLVDREVPFSEQDTLVFVEQMLLGVEACHKRNFAHIDVKIENMVFREASASSELVLVDFGAAQRFVQAPYATKSETYREGLDDETLTPARPAGTIPYNAPEVLNGHFSSRSDVWSVGVSMFVLLTGRRPFNSSRAIPLEAERSITRQIKYHGEVVGNRELPLPETIASEPTRAFLHRLTSVSPRDRMSATEAITAIRQLPAFPKPPNL